MNLAQLELTRTRDLHGRKLVSVDALDRATSAQVQANARLQSLIAEQKSASLAARPDALIAADAVIASAEAALAGAQWRAKQTRVSAQASARVEDVLYQLGEWVPTGAPVLKLLPEQGPFVRFFVPMQALASWQPGALVALSCSACPAGLRARVNFIAAAPEYTPPVIFSETRSDDLVYRIEAKLEQPTLLAPGLPVVVQKL